MKPKKINSKVEKINQSKFAWEKNDFLKQFLPNISLTYVAN